MNRSPRHTMNERRSNDSLADVCIVGAGPAGMTLARELGLSGRTVIVLESGSHDVGSSTQDLNDADVEGVPYQGLRRTRHRQVGGTANIWDVSVAGAVGAKYVPLSRRDVATWPVSWDTLEPYYREAQMLCGLGPFEYGADVWTTPECRPFHLDGTGLVSGVYQFGAADVFTRGLVERVEGVETVTLAPGISVTGLLFDAAAGRILGVRTVDEHDRPSDVKARAVVLACGAVENARLLMMSGASRSEWLGRCFMEHARDFSLVLLPDSPGLFAEASFYDFRIAGGTWVGGRLSISDVAMDAEGIPNASVTLTPKARSSASRPGVLSRLHRPLRRAKDSPWEESRYGWSSVRAPEDVFDAFRMVLNLEQRPNPTNRITLGSRRDRFGNPLPRLVLEWTDAEQAGLNRLRVLLASWFRSAKLGRLVVRPEVRPDLSAHHHAGTTRMGSSQADGVVDSQGRVFGFDNLYVAGASVFPTAGFANPTLTVVAMSIRLARSIGASL